MKLYADYLDFYQLKLSELCAVVEMLGVPVHFLCLILTAFLVNMLNQFTAGPFEP